MIDVDEKVRIACKNWYEADGKGLSTNVIKEAYERGFNRAYRLMKSKEPSKVHDPKRVQVIGTVGVLDIRFADCPWCGARIHDNESQNYCGSCGKAVKWDE